MIAPKLQLPGGPGGGGGSGGHTIQDEGVDLPAETHLNFVGATVAVTDDPGNTATKVTITAQPLDATLTSISALGSGAGKMLYTTGVDTWAETDITAAGRALLDDATAANQRTTLGLGTMATETATDYVAKSLYDAQTVLGAVSDNTPVAITVAEQTLVGRVTGGDVGTVAIDSDLTAVSATHDTVPSAKATSVALALKVNNTGDETIAGVKTFSSDPIIPDEAYGAGWNGSLEPPTKNAVYDKIETLSAGGYGTIQEEGSGVTQRATMNFIGAGVTAADDAGNSRTNITVHQASTTQEGTSESATAAETTTGTDAVRHVTPDGLAGSDYGKRLVMIPIGAPTSITITGNGQGFYWRCPAVCNGWNLVTVAASVATAGTTGTLDIQVRNATQAVDMLTTKITIDSTETDSSSAATAAVIDTSNDDVATGDQIYIDIDAVQTTPAKGLVVELTFQLP